MGNTVFDNLLQEINSSDINDKDKLCESIEALKHKHVNIMFVGATGVGKSSTINALFDTETAKVGYSVDPETSSVQKYEMDQLTLWDTPGFGDDPQKDQKYAAEIANALKLKDENGQLLIDEVVVLIDGSNRDMGTAYQLIENVVLPYIGDTNRMVIAINQCDMALKGRYWNAEQNRPDAQLETFLADKAASVRARIFETTEVITQPIFYSALYRYNITKLLVTMLRSIPEEKRFLLADSLNKAPAIWEKNDQLENYQQEVHQEIKGSLTKAVDAAAKCAVAGATIGSLIPVIGPAIGAAAGAVLGFLGGLFE